MPIYSNNSNNSNNAGNLGASLVLPDRVDLPFSTERDPTAPAGVNRSLGELRNAPARNEFPDRDWAAEWRAWHVLADFAMNNKWQALKPGETGVIPGLAVPNAATIETELQNLVIAAQTERLDAMGEILTQSVDFLDFFAGLLSMTPNSHPATWRIMNFGQMLPLYSLMPYKLHFARPRPSHLVPALLPPIPVPGHASYPSGHSTQAHLVALCLIDVLNPPPSPANTMNANLMALANRIARNRELAGLHYPSDSAGGLVLAQRLNELLNTNMPRTEPSISGAPSTRTKYEVVIDLARQEWS